MNPKRIHHRFARLPIRASVLFNLLSPWGDSLQNAAIRTLAAAAVFGTGLAIRAQTPSQPWPDYHRQADEFMALQMRDENGIIPANAWLNALAQKRRMPFDPRPWGGSFKPASPSETQAMVAGIDSNSWTSIGPGNVGGRIRSVLVNPTNTSILWIGSVGGGVWKSTNGGASWFAQDDFMAVLAIGCMVMDPTNPSVIFAGTGEGFNNADGLRGAGIFKTTDGGTTWNQLPTTANTSFYYVNRLAISPTNHQIMLAATGSGIFRSTNGGTNWTQQYSAESILDLAFNPITGTACVASGSTYGASGLGLYSSDAGVTWNTATGLPTAGRIEIAYAPSSPNIVYASANNNSGQIYASTNGGVSYTLHNTGNNYLGGQGWYDNCIWVDPTNPNILVVGGLDLWRSTDGGNTLTDIGGYSGASVHPDQHAIVQIPTYNGSTIRTVFVGNDGGIFRATDIYTAAPSSGWTKLNNNLGITQFYGAAGNNTSGTIVGGTQDNGTPRFTTPAGSNGWSSMFGGDGGYCASDPSNANYFYGEYVYLQIFRSTDGGVSANYIYSGLGDAGVPDLGDGDPDGGSPKGDPDSAANFIAPFILDPNNPNTMLAGGSNLWRSVNVKAGTPTWSNIKNGANGSFISAIAVAAGNSDIIWVGHNNGDVYSTTNGTAASPTWTRKDLGSPNLPNRTCTRLTIDSNNWNRVFATFGGFNSDNVYRTTDGGTTWANIATGLPSAPIHSLVIAAFNTNYLYVGTDIGVFATADGGATWSPGNECAANAAVDELFWMGNNLVAATHGRGLFKIAVIEPLQITPATGFVSTGYVGGVFSITNQSFTLTNIGSSSFSWALANTSVWLNASPSSGTLAGNGATSVAVSLAPAATSLAVGNYTNTILFTNLSDNAVQSRQFALEVSAPPEPLQILPGTNLVFARPIGGVFAVTNQSFTLTNISGASLNWSLLSTSVWFSVSPGSGFLASGGAPAVVSVNLSPLANNLAQGTYSNTIWFTNLSDSVVQSRQISVLVEPIVLNGGFETGDFSFWTTTGSFSSCLVSTSPTYAHSGLYGAEMGPSGALSYLSQNLPTVAGQLYLLSFWLDSPDGATPNEFSAAWNGSTLFDQTNLPVLNWTNMQFFVNATGPSTVLQFGFQNDPSYFGFDDVSVTPVYPPALQSVVETSGNISFAWNAGVGLTYQVEYTTNLSKANWLSLGSPILATNSLITITDPVGPDRQRFYRVQIVP
ncbi:conserved hypothetical protein [Verrucomicrobia bacterium]|nr:conserved hypothetical protein [Verrucomicrobiota bacterium]